MMSRNTGSAGRPAKFFAKALGISLTQIQALVDKYPTLFEISGSRLRIADSARPHVHEFLTKATRQCDIHFLLDYLNDLDPTQWQTLFPFISVSSSRSRRRWQQFVSVIDHMYLTPRHVSEYIETLPITAEHKAVFQYVYESDTGVVPFDDIAAAFTFHPSKLEHLLLELEQRALLFERYEIHRNKSPKRTYSLLKELAQFFRSERNNGHKPVCTKLRGTQKAPANSAWEELNLAYSVSCLVAHLQTHSLRITRNYRPHKTDLRKFVPLLNMPETSLIKPESICDIAYIANLALPSRNNAHLELTELAESFSQLDLLERQKKLFEILVLADVSPDREVLNDIVSVLAKLRQDRWYRLSEVVKYAEYQFMDGNQPVEEFTLSQRGAHWMYDIRTDKRERIDLFKRYVLGPLFISGGVKLAPVDKRTEKISITSLGRYLMDLDEPEKVELPAASIEERALVVQPNFQIIVSDARFDPVHFATLDAFCSRNGNGRATVFHIEKHSVERGIQKFGSVKPFIEFLERHNKHGSVPANVTSTLHGWDSGMKRIKVRRLGVIESDDELVLMELLNSKKLKKYLSDDGKPCKFVVFSSISTTKLKNLLKNEGYFIE